MRAGLAQKIAPKSRWIALHNTHSERSHTRPRLQIVVLFQLPPLAGLNLARQTADALTRKVFGLHTARFLLATTRIYGL